MKGSAADIVKLAMIYIHDVIGEDSEASLPSFINGEEFLMLKHRCRILLQVHDELVLEADSSVVKEAGLLLQTCMERAVSLLGIVFKKVNMDFMLIESLEVKLTIAIPRFFLHYLSWSRFPLLPPFIFFYPATSGLGILT
ncbi:DNA polymerase theta-like [Dorcoceras hygrometricum]|uniref:DNA polymerase theta-like n=1 Tax=Dorcoceras hygrometricum TaxID=472368 RepID=A0A2Z7BI22_9LAMI|nr:DNA polymerase theta-like [Dorcoceras hygrometricum]